MMRRGYMEVWGEDVNGRRCVVGHRPLSHSREIMRAALRKADVNVDRMTDEELNERYSVLVRKTLHDMKEEKC